MPSARAGVLVFMLLGAIPGCSTMNAYSNKPLISGEIEPDAGPVGPAYGELRPVWEGNSRCFQRARPLGPDIMAVTISGGGSRAAVLGAAVMLELQEIGALGSVDLISSVSGGSLPAALYTLSRDPEEAGLGPGQDESRRMIWQRDEVLSSAGTDLISPWLLRWLRPDSIARYWFTAYDRTDLFADMLNAQMFAGVGADGGYPTFADLNPRRPVLILNATNFTATKKPRFTDVFTFTPWNFAEVLNSDICSYSVARAVSASAAFPGVLHYSTLRDYSEAGASGDPDAPISYVHLMDGGATDNLGIKGLDQTMQRLDLCGETSGQPDATEPCKRLVLVVDAQNGFKGRDGSVADPRGVLGRFVDMNFLDAYDTLMQTGYGQLLRSFRQDVEERAPDQSYGAVLHLPVMALLRDKWVGYDGQYVEPECPEDAPAGPGGSAIERSAFERACALVDQARAQLNQLTEAERDAFQDKLGRIDTDWRIAADEVACLEVAAYALVAAARPELQEFLGDDEMLDPQDAARFDQNIERCLEQPDAAA
jgi:predicted acylesterase/phospholipase RssA